MSEQEEPKNTEEGTKITWTDPADGEEYEAYEITLLYKGNNERFVMREITLGEEGTYLEAIAEVTLSGSTMIPRINLQRITTESVYLSLCEAPFDCTPGQDKRTKVSKLKASLGNELGHYAEKLNNFSELKKVASDTPSSTALPTDDSKDK